MYLNQFIGWSLFDICFFWFIMLFCLSLIVLYCCILLYFFGCHCRKSFHCCNSDNSTTSCNGDGMLLDHNSIIDIIIQICFIIIFLPFFHLVVEAPMRLSFSPLSSCDFIIHHCHHGKSIMRRCCGWGYVLVNCWIQFHNDKTQGINFTTSMQKKRKWCTFC